VRGRVQILNWTALSQNKMVIFGWGFCRKFWWSEIRMYSVTLHYLQAHSLNRNSHSPRQNRNFHSPHWVYSSRQTKITDTIKQLRQFCISVTHTHITHLIWFSFYFGNDIGSRISSTFISIFLLCSVLILTTWRASLHDDTHIPLEQPGRTFTNIVQLWKAQYHSLSVHA